MKMSVKRVRALKNANTIQYIIHFTWEIERMRVMTFYRINLKHGGVCL